MSGVQARLEARSRERLEQIEGGNGSDDDIAEIAGWLDKVTDGNRCYLAVEEQVLMASILRAFGDEFAEHLQLGRCPRPRDITFPKIVDLVDGTAVYDRRVALKQPDWTYADEPTHVRVGNVGAPWPL